MVGILAVVCPPCVDVGGKFCCCDVSKLCCSSGESPFGWLSPKLLESASDFAWARRASNTTRLFAAVMPTSPNTEASTGFFCWSVRPTFLGMYSVQFV